MLVTRTPPLRAARWRESKAWRCGGNEGAGAGLEREATSAGDDCLPTRTGLAAGAATRRRHRLAATTASAMARAWGIAASAPNAAPCPRAASSGTGAGPAPRCVPEARGSALSRRRGAVDSRRVSDGPASRGGTAPPPRARARAWPRLNSSNWVWSIILRRFSLRDWAANALSSGGSSAGDGGWRADAPSATGASAAPACGVCCMEGRRVPLDRRDRAPGREKGVA